MDGDYQADEVSLKVAGRSATIEEAFGWLLTMIDRHALTKPRIDIVPTWIYNGDPHAEGEFYFQISVCGEPHYLNNDRPSEVTQ